MKLISKLSILFALFALIAPLSAQENEQGQIQTIKKMTGFIRYGRDDRAVASIGAEQISRYLLGSHYDHITPEQQTKFQENLKEIIKLRGFPLAMKYFKDIDISYDQPVENGDQSKVRSSILYAGSERIVFTWVLTKVGDTYLITDFLNERGESSMQKSRDQQILPLFQQRGITGVLDSMQTMIRGLRGQ